MNPVAEYAFRKAVSMGYINDFSLTDDYVQRHYETDEKKQQAKDLREKLPEFVRGPETWAKLNNNFFK
ncbi:hypothetical protein D3C71_2055260 [compost metagenome]